MRFKTIQSEKSYYCRIIDSKASGKTESEKTVVETADFQLADFICNKLNTEYKTRAVKAFSDF